jgi:DNA-binding MarR family transcriptional regulator
VVREAAGIPLSWYDVLLELAAEPDGRLRMSDLADRVVLSRTRVSRVSDELVARGLVVKEDYPGDRRSAYAVITDQGRRAFRTAAPIYLQAIEDKFAAALTNEELEQVTVLLNKVLRSDA